MLVSDINTVLSDLLFKLKSKKNALISIPLVLATFLPLLTLSLSNYMPKTNNRESLKTIKRQVKQNQRPLLWHLLVLVLAVNHHE